MEDAISSERNTKYRQYDIHTQVVGLIPPYLCAFTVAHSAAPHSDRIVRRIEGDFHSAKHAHDVALANAIELVKLILADTDERRAG